MEYYIDPVAFMVEKTNTEAQYVRNLIELLNEGATIPFIARYRKERTGSMDEVRIGEIKTLYEQYQELEKRKSRNAGTFGHWRIFICLINRKNRQELPKQKQRV